ncbi:MAG: PHB depolymerase family esterase [Anaerolineaceae bacterium]
MRQVTSAGIERSYRLHLPPNLSMAKPAAVVLNFHGLGSNAIEQEAYSGFAPVSDREGFILVSPDGTGSPRGWASSPNLPTGVDDVRFTRDLLDRIQTDFCIDTARIFSTGMSNGAFMSSRLACVLSDRIAAVAPVAGVSFTPVERCGAPVPILAFHGTADRTVPFEEGLIFGVLPYAGARKYTADWASHNGCSPTPQLSKVSEAVTRESYPKCGGADVMLVIVKGGGHTWPGASIEIGRLGETTKDVSATEEIWKFFAAHSLTR